MTATLSADVLRPHALEVINGEAARIRTEHPFPRPRTLAELPEPESTAWIRTQDALIAEVLTRGALDHLSMPHTWVDVQLTDGRWVGRWSDHSLFQAALHTACWFDQPITAAGIGLKQTTTDADHLQARIDGGELLALLGDTW
jgi:hypothetical protein